MQGDVDFADVEWPYTTNSGCLKAAWTADAFAAVEVTILVGSQAIWNSSGWLKLPQILKQLW